MRTYLKTFDAFQRQVNYRIEARLGLSIYDLPDSICFDDYWHDDCETNDDEFWNAVEMATEDILLENGFENVYEDELPINAITY